MRVMELGGEGVGEGDGAGGGSTADWGSRGVQTRLQC